MYHKKNVNKYYDFFTIRVRMIFRYIMTYCVNKKFSSVVEICCRYFCHSLAAGKPAGMGFELFTVLVKTVILILSGSDGTFQKVAHLHLGPHESRV